MVSFTLDAVKFLLIYRYLQNTYWFKRGNRTLLPVPRSKGSRIALSVETSNAESPTPMWIYTIHPFPLRIHQWLYKVQWGLYIIHPEDIHRCFVFDWHFWICEILRTSKPKRKVNAFSNLCQFPHHPNRRGAIENYTKIQFNWTNR